MTENTTPAWSSAVFTFGYDLAAAGGWAEGHP
jgi:hypothetical protein